jgi:hypothetical protein
MRYWTPRIFIIHESEFQAMSTTINIKVKSPGAMRPKTHRHYLAEKVDFLQKTTSNWIRTEIVS